MIRFINFTYSLLLLFPFSINAQVLNGTVTANGNPTNGAYIVVPKENIDQYTDWDGNYTLHLTPGSHEIIISYIGYEKQTFEIHLKEGEEKHVTTEVNLTCENKAISIDTQSTFHLALPVDDISEERLRLTGHNTLEKVMNNILPSFNAVNTPNNLATRILEPYEFRGMGPSRTLILVNGKRKNASSMLYLERTPGYGESAVDINAIPLSAIESMEIIKGGGSARYGSGAIAGVMNIITKKKNNGPSITMTGGITGKGDGESYGFSFNNGSNLGKKTVLNYTVELSKITSANRSGKVDVEGEFSDFIYIYPGNPDYNPYFEEIAALNEAGKQDLENFLREYPSALNKSGPPETTAAKFALSVNSNISAKTSLYGHGNFAFKAINSVGIYKNHYWRTLSQDPYLQDFFYNGPNGEYIGYQPILKGNLSDYNGTIGLKNSYNNWITDISFTVGSNKQSYLLKNSVNRSYLQNPDGTNKYRENSPTTFNVGGTQFQHYIGNIDVVKNLHEKLKIHLGGEYKHEMYMIEEGEEGSYEERGSDGFRGTEPRFSGNFSRYNIGGYAGLHSYITDHFHVNGTARVDHYDVIGKMFVWEFNSNYSFLKNKNFTIRASISTAFNAPSLHQIHTQKSREYFNFWGNYEDRLFNFHSEEGQTFGLPQLHAERSKNISLGFLVKPNSKWNISWDFYQIKLKDRIILSNAIGRPDGESLNDLEEELNSFLNNYNFYRINFFINALNTRTSGIDFVTNYRDISIGKSTLGLVFALNYTFKNEKTSSNFAALEEEIDQYLTNPSQEALYFSSQPKYKVNFSINYQFLRSNRMKIILNNTLFGPTTFRQVGLKKGLYTEFEPKLITDIGLRYRLSKVVTVTANVNNLLNILPKWNFKADPGSEAEERLNENDEAYLQNESNIITFNQRFSQMTNSGFHINQLGTICNLTIDVEF